MARAELSPLRWLKEPTLHFFVMGALLFACHRAFGGDQRVIVVTAGIRANVARRFTDSQGRRPTSAELARAIEDWKRDEALYREALREGLDRDDATIRTVLADKVRARAALEVPKREPSPEELERWLEANRRLYETPLRYDYQLVAFAKTPAAQRELEAYERELSTGKAASQLGQPLTGGALTLEELAERYGAQFAEGVRGSTPGQWRRFERADEWLLVRVLRTLGGLPPPEELRPRLVADWSRAAEERAVEQAVTRIVERYVFEAKP
jgi:hypothetical protein